MPRQIAPSTDARRRRPAVHTAPSRLASRERRAGLRTAVAALSILGMLPATVAADQNGHGAHALTRRKDDRARLGCVVGTG